MVQENDGSPGVESQKNKNKQKNVCLGYNLSKAADYV